MSRQIEMLYQGKRLVVVSNDSRGEARFSILVDGEILQGVYEHQFEALAAAMDLIEAAE